MHIRYVPTSEDFDNFSFEATHRLSDFLFGDIDLPSLFDDEGEDHE